MNVGADIESICGRCGDVWHVVVALAHGKIAKVQCKQCGRSHRYRPPGGTAKASTTRKTKTKTRRTSSSAANNGTIVEGDLTRAVRPYRMSDAYTPGDRIEHNTFGSGVVQSEVGAGKIEILFAAGTRVLVHDKTP